MTVFDKLLADFSAMTGLELSADPQGSCRLEADGLVITLQYLGATDDVVVFAPVTDPDDDGGLTPAKCKKALSLAFDGKGTSGAFLGLFCGALVLTVHLPMAGLDAETLGVRLTAFADAAVSVRAEIAAAVDDAADAAGPQEGVADAVDRFVRV